MNDRLISALDDGIVVVGVKKGRSVNGNGGSGSQRKAWHRGHGRIAGVCRRAGRHWKDDVLVITGERFGRRLGHEIGAFRLEVAKELAAMRVELATTRVSLLKWSFLFWIGQFAAVSGMMAFLLRTIGTR